VLCSSKRRDKQAGVQQIEDALDGIHGSEWKAREELKQKLCYFNVFPLLKLL
jgi:hypothetical protein